MSAPVSQTSRLFLTGFSGTGKSSVATLVAGKLGWRVLDTDALIEESAGASVAAVFARDGEPGSPIEEEETTEA